MSGLRHTEFYLTASEAYPALEQAFLGAQSEIIASFRVFDPTTTLRSKAGTMIGATWGDLIRHVVLKGVRVTIRISDFDPVVGAELHQKTHAAIEGFRTAVGDSNLFDVQPAMHPWKIGVLPRLLLWPRTYPELRRHAQKLRDMDARERDEALRHMPCLKPLLSGEGHNIRARVFPPPSLHPVTHHQKLAVFDQSRLYIGGLDVNDRRYDTLDHKQSGSQTWHDVQVMVEGKSAQAAHRYLTAFAAGDAAKLDRSYDGLLRTHSKPRKIAAPFLSPQPVLNEIETAHRKRFDTTRNLIFIETQFFRDRGLTEALCAVAKRNPELGLVIVLPAAPETVAFEGSTGSDARYGEYLQAKCLDQISKTFGQRAFIAAAAQPRAASADGRGTLDGAALVYVHAKVSIFDDSNAIVSSANLNGRSMKWDTEAGVEIDDPAAVKRLRQRCFAHWLGHDIETEDMAGVDVVQMWRRLAETNQRKQPSQRSGFILPYPITPARRFGRNLPGLPEETV